MKGPKMFTYSRLLDVYYISPENLRMLAVVAVVGALLLAIFVISGICDFVRGLINLPKEKKAAEELNELRSIKEKYNDLRAIVLSDPNLRSAYAELLVDGE
jgi:hypothetical protein|nr:MAG TPA: hypothetical protein [Caudoviricetes sp.]DAV69201.1 MAG TPA: hypothetical protein [Caudoviricetes sp.]DAX34378.1 MAG TPA: hypothetical protein [Caudoviricetes sp.]